jgi:hypothetical protein
VGAEQDFMSHRLIRRNPGEGQIRLMPQPFDGGRDAPGIFRMAGARVTGAAFVSDDFHWRHLITACRAVARSEGGLTRMDMDFCADGILLFNGWHFVRLTTKE